MKIDVICPLWRADLYIDRLICGLQSQRMVELDHVIFPVTETENDGKVLARITQAGFDYFLLSKDTFSHSLTREKAMSQCGSNVVIMMSQDVILCDEYCLYRLANEIRDKVIFAYGRQICRKKTLEYYTRCMNYGEESFLVSKSDIDRMQLRAFFGSDAFSAYNREKFLELGGYDHIPMMFNEDMYYVRKVLLADYQKAYAAEAVVEHSHDLTLKQLYRRYYQTGLWFSQHPEFDGYQTTGTGGKLAFQILRAALQDRNIPVLVRYLPDMAARYLGMCAGKRSEKQ